MAAKLKNLKIRKVDLVDEGANPDAHARLCKKKEALPGPGGTETGTGNVLKRLFGFIGRAAGIGQDEIDSAVEEIQKGDSISFSGKIHQIDMGRIADEMWDICSALQSSLCSILNDGELDSAAAEAAMRQSLEEFHSLASEAAGQWAAGRLSGIVRKSADVPGEELELMKAAAERLWKAVTEAEAAAGGPGAGKAREGEEDMGLKIDKSRMTDAERAFLESIEKRYGTEDGGVPGAAGRASYGTADAARQPSGMPPAGQASAWQAQEQPGIWQGPYKPVGKSMPGEWAASAAQAGIQAQPPSMPAAAGTPAAGTPQAGTQAAPPADDVYKGLHPAVRAELEGLRKFREAAEERELAEAAAKYEIIGKKKEELIPLFKSLKAAGGTAYDDMISVLDQTAAAVEKSGIFSEIGKSGHGGTGTGQAEAKIQGIAKGYMEKDPALGWNAAVAKAWEDNPDIIGEYDEEAGF